MCVILPTTTDGYIGLDGQHYGLYTSVFAPRCSTLYNTLAQIVA